MTTKANFKSARRNLRSETLVREVRVNNLNLKTNIRAGIDIVFQKRK